MVDRKLTILVDMDDVLEDLLAPWVCCLNQKFGCSVSVSDIHSWGMRTYYPHLTKEEIFSPLADRSFWDTVYPKPHAQEYLKRLMDDGRHVYICTSSHYKTIADKMERVLFKHFPYVKWENVIIANHKQMIRADVMIDDGVHNLIGADCVKILMDAPHNARFDHEAHGVIRVHAWKEIYDLICRIAKDRC